MATVDIKINSISGTPEAFVQKYVRARRVSRKNYHIVVLYKRGITFFSDDCCRIRLLDNLIAWKRAYRYGQISPG